VVDLPARIGINAIFLAPGMGGIDTYVRELVGEMLRAAPRTRFSVFCSPAGRRHLSKAEWANDVRFISPSAFGLRGTRALIESTLLGAIAARRVQLLHSVAMTAPLRPRLASVVTIHDVIWMHGRASDPTTGIWRLLVPPAARRADRVIAVSAHAAREIARVLAVAPSKIDITPLGHRSSFSTAGMTATEIRTRLALGDGPIVLSVGTRKPHKNMIGLLRAMPRVRAAHPDVRLVLAGNPTAHEPALLAEAERLGIAGQVTFLPFVSAEELEGLYAAATCFVLPSLQEGFGLPILEAMARGVPVACSAVSALPEVAGGAARLFDPHEPDQIAAAITELLGDSRLRECLIRLGSRRAAQRSWSATAAATLASYERAWSAHRSGAPAPR
jgi:glycosyltransferase involved in cell wall biosynthesis